MIAVVATGGRKDVDARPAEFLAWDQRDTGHLAAGVANRAGAEQVKDLRLIDPVGAGNFRRPKDDGNLRGPGSGVLLAMGGDERLGLADAEGLGFGGGDGGGVEIVD